MQNVCELQSLANEMMFELPNIKLEWKCLIQFRDKVFSLHKDKNKFEELVHTLCFSYYALYLYLYQHIYIFYCTKLVLPTLAFTLSKFMWIEINLWCWKRIWKELYLWAFQNLSYSSSSLFHICMKCDCYPNINQSCAYPIAYTLF